MNIKPSSPQGPRNPADTGALESARTAEARKAEAGPPKNAVDGRGQARAEQQEARPAGSSLRTDRLKQISERLETGFSDQPAVIDQLARRLSKDPGFMGTE